MSGEFTVNAPSTPRQEGNANDSSTQGAFPSNNSSKQAQSLQNITNENASITPEVPDATNVRAYKDPANSTPQPDGNSLIELLGYAEEITTDLEKHLNAQPGVNVKLVLLPFFSRGEQASVGGRNRNRRKKGGSGEDKNVNLFALACVNMYDNPVFVNQAGATYTLDDAGAKSVLDAIVTHKDLLDDACKKVNNVLISLKDDDIRINEFQNKCKDQLQAGLPGQILSASNGSAQTSRININNHMLYIGTAMLDLVAHINRTKAMNFNDTNLTITLSDYSIIQFIIKKEEGKYKLYWNDSFEITHVSMIPLVENTTGTNIIINIETTIEKTVKAKVALAKVESIGDGAYNAYLQEKNISRGNLHASRFVTVRNIHFIYRLKNPEEKQREANARIEAEAAAEEARKAKAAQNANAAKKANVAAEKARKAQEEAKTAAKTAANTAVDTFFRNVGETSDTFFLFKVVKNLMDPEKMKPFF
jgi:hypothetical protein